MTKQVVLFGKGELAVKIAGYFLHSQNFDLKLVVPVIPEPKWTDSLVNWCVENDVPFIESGNYVDIPEEMKVELAVSIYYSNIFKKWFIDKCGKIINLHNAPLPKYRGGSPINWALKNKEKTHGVTIHEITPGIDDGPIISQVNFSIYPETDEVKDVLNRCYDFGWVLFQQTIERLDDIASMPQDESKALYYSKKQNELLGERRYFTREESREKMKNQANAIS
ncbi:MAG: formyl transferase [Flavobacteriales bacterium]|nr:hypothetical protein [Bacteroidales bacterium AH-315-I05]PCJ81813.1 MAG: formyl transferase [Flavobacteriales bacterium]